MFPSALFLVFAALQLAAAKPTAPASGALFFATNDDSGNNLIVNKLDASGKATFVGALATGGKGALGINAGPDGLFAQDSVLVHGNSVLTVNAGSNSLSLFHISSSNPLKVTRVGKAVDSGGEFPVAVAVNPKRSNQACVLNGGKVNGVQCYEIGSFGLKVEKNSKRSLGLNQTTPASGPPNSVSDIVFTEDGKKLLASVKGAPPVLGFIAEWDVGHDGSLSKNFKKISASAGGLPFSITLIPGRNALLVTDPAVGATTYGLGNKVVTKAIPITGQGAVCWSSVSKVTKSFFLTDIVTAKVTEVSVDANLQGKVVKQYQLTPGSATIDNAIGHIYGKDFLYVLAPNGTTPVIDVLSVGKTPGHATSIQTFDIGAALTRANIKFSRRNIQGLAVHIPK